MLEVFPDWDRLEETLRQQKQQRMSIVAWDIWVIQHYWGGNMCQSLDNNIMQEEVFPPVLYRGVGRWRARDWQRNGQEPRGESPDVNAVVTAMVVISVFITGTSVTVLWSQTQSYWHKKQFDHLLQPNLTIDIITILMRHQSKYRQTSWAMDCFASSKSQCQLVSVTFIILQLHINYILVTLIRWLVTVTMRKLMMW